MSPTNMTFFQRFEADILSGKKTITIRDNTENNYTINSIVQVSTYENERWFCALKILSIEAIKVNLLTEFHAQQENMTLIELRNVIQDIYPNIEDLFVISFELINGLER